MLEVAVRRCDGVHPYLTTPEHTARAREILGPEPLLVPEQEVVLGDGREEALELGRGHLGRYLELPNYRNSWLREGFAGVGSERLVEWLVAWGGEDAALRRVGEHHFEAGDD